ncbi:MAG: CoA transferase [Gammaproteobacteria bacterium]|nr:CoA transferase [Gammaproteobacteria bacterium]
MNAALDGVRVLDLTSSRGELAGRLLADLGADVLKVDSPQGHCSSAIPPFTNDGTSLFETAYKLGKRLLDLDLMQPQDRKEFLKLVQRADVLIETFSPGFADSIGVGYQQLSHENPALIYAAITPFGQEGPKALWPATDLTIEAAGGRISLQGDPDRPPLPVGFPQAFLHASAQVAADIVVALNERCLSGLGQFLDNSAQETMWWTLMNAQGSPVCDHKNPPGVGDDRATHGRGLGTQIVAAKDGLVTIAPGASSGKSKSMYGYAVDEAKQLGESADALESFDWNNWVPHYRSGELTRKHLQLAGELLKKYIGRRSKLELVDWALKNDLRLGPLNTTQDLLKFPQFTARQLFKTVNGIQHPANWVQMSRTPLRHGAQSNVKIGDIQWEARREKAPLSSHRSGNAFDGIKVADFSWVAAGPTIAKCLADHGATVVKVESQTRPDLSRTLPPYIDSQPGINRSYWSFLYGTSKLSLQCNLTTAQGRKLARKMCDWADVVIESFSPGTMKRFGLDYKTLSNGRPELIMFSTSMLGQTGPLSKYAGFGQQAAGFCGLHYITGWPDRDPCGVASPYTDVVAPKFGIASLASAIYERRKTGLGQHIDLAQAECSMMFLAPLVLNQAVNGTTACAQGFDSPYACPQGVFQCVGIERYIAISTETTEQWRALSNLVPEFEFRNKHYDRFENRWNDRQQINEAIGSWTEDKDPFELESLLVKHEIPVSVVMRPLDVFNDPQIEVRGIKQVLRHTECGDVVHFGFPTRFSAKHHMVRTAPPCIGEHNDYVLGTLLGLCDDEVNELIMAGAIE